MNVYNVLTNICYRFNNPMDPDKSQIQAYLEQSLINWLVNNKN